GLCFGSTIYAGVGISFCFGGRAKFIGNDTNPEEALWSWINVQVKAGIGAHPGVGPGRKGDVRFDIVNTVYQTIHTGESLGNLVHHGIVSQEFTYGPLTIFNVSNDYL